MKTLVYSITVALLSFLATTAIAAEYHLQIQQTPKPQLYTFKISGNFPKGTKILEALYNFTPAITKSDKPCEPNCEVTLKYKPIHKGTSLGIGVGIGGGHGCYIDLILIKTNGALKIRLNKQTTICNGKFEGMLVSLNQGKANTYIIHLTKK